MSAKFAFLSILFLFLFAACSPMGITHHKSPRGHAGQPEALRICIYQDPDVPDRNVGELIRAIDEKFAPFGLRVEVPWVRPWKRSAFAMQGLVEDIAMQPLECPCDRLLAIAGRDYRDFFWGMILPEYFGAVESVTFTKGYAVGERGSFNQILSMKDPKDVAVHEAFHFLGCGHEFASKPCLERVESATRAARENRSNGYDFFPAISSDGRILRTRAEVDRLLAAKLGMESGIMAKAERADLDCG